MRVNDFNFFSGLKKLSKLVVLPETIRIWFLVFLFLNSSCQLNNLIELADQSSQSSQVTIESQADGSGTTLTNANLEVSQTLTFYAIQRDSQGQFVSNIEVSWVLVGSNGSLNIAVDGKSAEFTATTVGSGIVKITSGATTTKQTDITVTAPLVTFTHGGWSDVKALGPKRDYAGDYIQPNGTNVGTDLNQSDKSIMIAWNDFSGGTETGYEVFRADTSGGQNFSSALATISSASTKTYTDTTVTPGKVYYYVVRPTIGGADYPTTESYKEIKVTAPPENMALVHRWIANQEVCGLMSKTTDPDNNYRCAFTGQGNTGGFYDLGADLIVDRFEAGCNFTSNSCSGGTLGGGPADCSATDDPGGTITASLGDVYYQQGSAGAAATCYINTNGGTTWQAANGATQAQLGSMISSRAHLPPLVRIDQTESWDACSSTNMQVNIDDGGSVTPVNKSLLTQKQWRAAAAWSPILSDTDIFNIESDGDTDGDGTPDLGSSEGYCNTDFTDSGGIRDHSENTGIAYNALRTGSQGTIQCQSRYGIQDLVGNPWEWTSDQCEFTGTSCAIPSSPLDATNIDIGGWTIPSGNEVSLDTLNHFSPSLGIPLNSVEDGSIDSATFATKYFGDYFYDNFGGSGLRGLLVGGGHGRGSRFGRWTSDWSDSPPDIGNSISLRCGSSLQ